ncbi:MAG: CoB--CoM heterodisulfide reductase iron-sulfur subunit B family protein [Dehalococcoidia bacterium]|nr:CoB--CoM heterodisulfide reductase iron-sulfur subunit B family protein [Dehalococcoidia bacterium]MDH4299259.1 CoB--CoM heterodisulfide reductase iron-sulfur subunit B family protein [Dehalococcoidia bacterium]MDH4366797.1 CoB--CoM heterodisulfide reductase iron-sulfur subunit B family protein [Dehalococcoidia bacterium]
MSLAYYPGCTLKTRARNLEEPAVASMKVLGLQLDEVPRWNCCGGVYSLAEDDLIHQVAPIRNLIRVKKQGKTELVTLCAFCLNTLKRANLLMKEDVEKRNTINSFIDEGLDYSGEVEVVHLLEVLRDYVGWDVVSQMVKLPLLGLKVAPYYGCTLLRPREVAIDNVESPVIFRDFLKALGARPVDFPESTRCCGSYQIVSSPDDIAEYARPILNSALSQGAEALVLTCPLCDYNLGEGQQELMKKNSGFRRMPQFYFTQLLALALGLDPKICHFELNYGKPESLLRIKNLLA